MFHTAYGKKSSLGYETVSVGDVSMEGVESFLPSEQDAVDAVAYSPRSSFALSGSARHSRTSYINDDDERIHEVMNVTAAFTTLEKWIAVLSILAFLVTTGSALIYYIEIHLHSASNPTMSITQENFENGVVVPFNLTIFPQISLGSRLGMTQTWNAHHAPGNISR